MFLSWWNQTERKEKFIQILTFFLFFGASLDLKGVLFGTPMTLAGLYIIYDCMKRKSLEGFYLPARYWLGLAVFMGTIVLASLVLGDGPNILAAFQNLYRCLPFIVIIYLGKQADIKYAALLGSMASVLVSSANMLYLTQYLGIKGRVGAFGNYPNYYASLLAGILPVLFTAFQDVRIRALKKMYFLQGIVALLGLWSLWKTGSRGAMLGLFGGGILMYGVICFYRKRFKQFLTGFTICFALASFVLLAGIPGGEIRYYGDAARLRMLRSCYAMWQDHKLAGVGLANWQKEYATTYLLKEEIEAEALQRYQEWKKAAEQRAAAARKAAAEKKAAEQKKAAVQKAAAAKKAAEQKKTTPQKAPDTKATAPKPKPQLTQAQKAAAARKAAAAKKAAAQKAEAAKKAAAEREAKQIAAWKQGAIKVEAAYVMPHNVPAWFFSATGSIGGAGYVFFVCWYIWMFCNEMKRSDVAWVDVVGFWVFLTITIHGMVDAGIIYKAFARLLYLVMGLSISYYYRAGIQRIPEEGSCSDSKCSQHVGRG